jgi:ATP-dependent helicase/nuclease subunit B
MVAIAQDHHAVRMWQARMADLGARIQAAGAHPARTVVLLPYFQLLPLARRAWAERHPDGFAPRFETTMSWARALPFEPGPADLSLDMARDLPAARHWLERAGMAQRAQALAPQLVEAAWQLASLAAAVPPAERPAWAAGARSCVARGLEAPALQVETALGLAAVEWAAASSYVTDSLLADAPATLDLLVVMQGLQAEPLHHALLQAMGERGALLSLVSDGTAGQLALQAAADAADEAERAAACVLRHLEAGRVPVALAATDRLLTRRIGALLAGKGIPMRDEQGWKLSTTRSAARVMACLRACAWDAACDEVLDWIKNAPAVPQGVASGVERTVRKAGVRRWRALVPADWEKSPGLATWIAEMALWREGMQGTHTLAQWLPKLRGLLQACGLWATLQEDAAGAQLIDLLRLHAGQEEEFAAPPHGTRRLRLDEFTDWVSAVLESGSFLPEQAPEAPVVILPFSQVLGRPFAALVLPGCDERSLPASPEPSGPWTATQREGLGLPSRDQLAANQAGAWAEALRMPHCDVLWRGGDEGGEPLLPSPLVQALLLRDGPGITLAADAREQRVLQPMPLARPQAIGAGLELQTLSASAYEDLRRCPYRFFALRQLGLKEAEEIEAEVDKRDFGTWLHAVLSRFHEALREAGELGRAERVQLLDEQARLALDALRLEEGEFLPFEAGWPAVRDGYLAWLEKHEASGARFIEAEGEHRVQLGPLDLMGRIDRIDRLPGGAALVMDYKTEGLQATRDRMKHPLEDTQLAFYAALVGEESLQAAYLNVGERGEVKEVKHGDVLQGRELLKQAIVQDLTRIAQGAPMPALGEGRVCEFCAARGLCRRDFWDA